MSTGRHEGGHSLFDMSQGYRWNDDQISFEEDRPMLELCFDILRESGRVIDDQRIAPPIDDRHDTLEPSLRLDFPREVRKPGRELDVVHRWAYWQVPAVQLVPVGQTSRPVVNSGEVQTVPAATVPLMLRTNGWWLVVENASTWIEY
jgi:hypothetical protein